MAIGGGRIVLFARSYQIYGNIFSGGTPISTAQTNGKLG